MKFKTIAILAAFCIALAVPSLQAQSYTIDPSSCSPGGAIYCYSVSATLNGDTQSTASFWIDLGVTQYNVLTAPSPNTAQFVLFHSPDLGTAQITQYFATQAPVTSGTHTATRMNSLTANFAGTGYSGVMTLNFSSYYSNGGGGRGGGGAGWRFSITGGNLNIFQNSARSPIAPTPNPPGMPPPFKKDASLSWTIHPHKLFGQYGYGTCSGVQPVAGPFYGGNGYWCEIYKGYCEVTQLGNQYQWVYWTDCASM